MFHEFIIKYVDVWLFLSRLGSFSHAIFFTISCFSTWGWWRVTDIRQSKGDKALFGFAATKAVAAYSSCYMVTLIEAIKGAVYTDPAYFYPFCLAMMIFAFGMLLSLYPHAQLLWYLRLDVFWDRISLRIRNEPPPSVLADHN